MQGHTKKRPTEKVELRFAGPPAKKEEAVRRLQELGFVDVSSSIPWREAFPEFSEEPEYSVALRGARVKEGLTQKELSRGTKIPQSHISAFENGKLEIGKERAKRLAEALNVDYRVFL